MNNVPHSLTYTRFKRYFFSYLDCLQAEFLAGLLACFILTANVHAGGTTASQTMKLRAVVLDPMEICTVTFDNAAGDTVSFGRVMPYQILGSPNDTSLNTLLTTSNFNGVYDTREPMAILKLSCTANYQPAFTAFSIKYGNASQDVTMANSTIRGFKLDHALNQDVLAFDIYVQDRYALSWGRPGSYVSPGEERRLNPLSFQQNASGYYVAYMDIFPGLYWIDATNKNSASGTISTSVDFVVTMN